MNSLLKISLVLGGISLATACSADVKHTAQSNTQHSAKSTKASPGKPTAPIFLDYKVLTHSPQVGDEIEIQIKLRSPLKATIHSNIDVPQMLNLLGDAQLTSRLNKQGEQESLPNLKVSANTEGLHYLRIVAELEHEGNRYLKPFVIPVQVGNVVVKQMPPGEVVIDANGQKLIVQPAESSKQ